MQGPSRRKKAEKRGRKAETFAVWWLRLKGYRILARRQKTPKGEVDIIARRGAMLVFIEVKARVDFDHGIEAITPHQVSRIVAAAQYWRSTTENQINFTCRFDIVLVRPYLLIKHIKNAFDEEGRAL